MKTIWSEFPGVLMIGYIRNGEQSEEIDSETHGQREGTSPLGKAQNRQMFDEFIDFLGTFNRGGRLVHVHSLHSPMERCVESMELWDTFFKASFGELKHTHTKKSCDYLDVSLFQEVAGDTAKEAKWLEEVTNKILSEDIPPDTNVLLVFAHQPHCERVPRKMLGDNPPGDLRHLLHEEYRLETSEILVLGTHDNDFIIFKVPNEE